MKVLRIILAAIMLCAAFLAFSAQRQGSGALVAQSVYLVALLLVIIDRVLMIQKERIPNGRALMQIGTGILVASLIFSPDFAGVVQTKRPGMNLERVVQLTEHPDQATRLLALEVCLQRRAFKQCRPAFERASQAKDPIIQALGKAGLRGRMGLKKR